MKNEIVRQEKENNEAITGLVQNLENEIKVNVETINSLRESLESKERVFLQYEKNNEKIRKELQDTIGIKSGHISTLLKDKFEFMGEWTLRVNNIPTIFLIQFVESRMMKHILI